MFAFNSIYTYAHCLSRGCRSPASSRLGLSYNNTKQCISCDTTWTTLWRVADDNVTLCNACGIRLFISEFLLDTNYFNDVHET